MLGCRTNEARPSERPNTNQVFAQSARKGATLRDREMRNRQIIGTTEGAEYYGRSAWWLRLLTYVTGLVNQELLLQNEYLAVENKILRAHLPARLRLSDPERSTLAEIGKRLGRKALAQVACVAKPATILAWYRRLIAQKFDGSKCRSYPGRPRIEPELEALIVQMARENFRLGLRSDGRGAVQPRLPRVR